jgi:hypothetical protein
VQPQELAAGTSFDVFLGGQQQQPPSPSRANHDQFPGGQQPTMHTAPNFDMFCSDQAPFPGGQPQSAPTSSGPGADFPLFHRTEQQPSTPKPAAAPGFAPSRTGRAPPPQPGSINPYQLSDQEFARFSAEDSQPAGQKSGTSLTPHIDAAASGVVLRMPPHAASHTGSHRSEKSRFHAPLPPSNRK